MATNPYFNEYVGEQNLLHDLTVETIRTMGRDMIYIPREYVNRDIVFGEDVLSKFTDSYPIEMYIQSITSFAAQMNIINKFGINITDKVTLQVAKRRFDEEVVSKDRNITHPREGDLIYFPFNKSLFEINYVEDKMPFFQFGILTTYTLTCELFTYSYETIDTGIQTIDEVEEKRKYNMYEFQISGSPIVGSSVFKRGDLIYQVSGQTGAGVTYPNATAEATIVEINGAFTYVKGVSGTFATGPKGTESVKSYDSGIEYYLLNYDITNVNLAIDPISGTSEIENDVYADAADNELKFSRDNPFSEECS
jgi:hypothetical protein